MTDAREYKINFVCPECGGTLLVTKQRALVYTPIIDYTVYEDKPPMEIICKAGIDEIDFVDVEKTFGYECKNCSDFKVKTDTELIKFLKENGMLEEVKNESLGD
jgi:DNA-directed RNA polymerase subunit RPC12/RpoP